ncbi:MAG: hypothetical protein ABFE07_08010, partial [Armatimonadia bacterium]
YLSGGAGGGRGWAGLVKKWGVRTMMLDTAQQNGLVKAALASGKWVEVARFGGTVLMEEAGAEGKSLSG